MKATSKSDADTWYGVRLPPRRCAASLSASTGNGRAGSTGRRVPSGGAASFIFFSAAATTSHASTTRTTREFPRRASSLSSAGELMPTRPPPAVKTGPPALPDASLRSNATACAPTRLMVPDVIAFGSRSGAPIV